MDHLATIQNQLTYRLFENGDEEGILRLWEKDSGWGPITLQQFNDWFINTPYGECLIVVASDDANIIRGQIVFAPSTLVADHRKIKSLRAAAPIVESSIRYPSLRNPEHPVMRLMATGLEFAKEKGYQFVFTFPAHAWISILKPFNQTLPYASEICDFSCFSISLKENDSTGDIENFSTDLIEQFSMEHEQLWGEAIKLMPVHCALHRDHRMLNRLGQHALKLETRSVVNDELLGFMIVKKDGLMIDLVARNQDDLVRVFEHSLSTLRSFPEKNSLPFQYLKGMTTPLTTEILKRNDHTKDSYQFAFGSWLLDEHLDFETLTTSRWYMMPLG
jgi:hypothetical protein